MAKKAEQGAGSRKTGPRPNVVNAAKRRGPGSVFWIALGVVAVVGIGALSWQATRPRVTASKIDASLPPLQAQGYVIGSPTAPVEVIEFGDFECPSCGQFATLTEPDVRTRLVNAGQIRFRFMDFPLDIHRNTWDGSLAASCANEQGRFWEMHDQIFANQDKWNGEATRRPRGPLGDMAKGIGLDMSKYNACMEAETYRRQIQANLQEGVRRGVSQTPSFVIGGQLLPGALPYDLLKKHVDDALKKMSGDSAKSR